MAAYQYSYVMKDVTKSFPGGREVFKGITLSFLPGVKIGVLGVNGAGKSTLLKIMAGVETEYGGEAWAAEGVRVGYLEQEPKLDAGKTVAENVMEAFGPLKAAMDRFNAISEKFAEPMEDDEMTALLAEQAELQEKIDAEDGWDLDRRVEIALDALRCPPPDASRSTGCRAARSAGSRCAGCCWKSRRCCCWTSPPTTWTRKASSWLEKTLRDYAGTVMIITHDRYFLDNVTNWILEIERGRGYPFEGNYSSWLAQKRKRLHAGGEGGKRPLPARSPPRRNGSSPPPAPGKPRAAPASPSTRRCCSRARKSATGVAEIVIPPGPRLGGTVIDRGPAPQGVRQPPPDRRTLNFKLPPGRHRRRDRPERRRQDHPVQA